jgi:hypothetical protein
MKVNIKKIVSAYNLLGEAKVSKLEDGEVIKIVKVRKSMRPIVEDYEAFLKDAQEKFRPEDWDDIQNDLRQWQEEGEKTSLSKERRIEINKSIVGYQSKVEKAVSEELSREVEIESVSLKEESLSKLLVENGWEVKVLDELEFLV